MYKNGFAEARENAVSGEGEDYFHSLFGDSVKLGAHSSHTEKIEKDFSIIFDEVGHFRSSAIWHIKIVDVNTKGLFVKFINSTHDKELDIGDHILQQKVNGQTVSLYRFLPNVIVQANSTVTVWAAASEATHQPPSDFLWKEQNKFVTSPNCTTILSKPNGEAIAWYTPIHWKQRWEKIETDIEFDSHSVVATLQKNVFQLPTATTTAPKGRQDQEETLLHHVGQVQVLIKREKEIPPTLFPTRSPWSNSPDTSGHPYGALTELPSRYNTMRQWAGKSRPDPDLEACVKNWKEFVTIFAKYHRIEKACLRENACLSEEEDARERQLDIGPLATGVAGRGITKNKDLLHSLYFWQK
ncbi:PREDICTED: intermediate filament tail domain-containing protein 1 [Elephantulus edwardii]|uniref:intermediate filament tail domain-containing protein 1 n=1 Tax=Elephantulus edwardii TaxID=28737 RepID=UPI0003F0E392|nr:PREDICTED: intermediate filament tail domain-containing protein 1 [Elephantulus edwardii]